MALKVPFIIARFFTLTHYRSRLHHLLLALLQSLPCLHHLLTPFLHTLPITFSLCQMILKHFHDKMQPFSSLIFPLFFFFFLYLTLLVSSLGHLWVSHSSATSNVPKSSSWFGAIFWSFSLPWWLRQQRTCLSMLEAQVQSLSQEDPWRRELQPTPVFLHGKSHGQRSLAGYSPWDHKEFDVTEQQRVKNLPAMQETQVQSLGQEDHLEKGMAPHSCILVWEIPG